MRHDSFSHPADDDDLLTETVAARLLKAADDPRHLEAPPDFDFVEATSRFLRLARAVMDAAGADCELELWPLIRGAAFHGSLVVPDAAGGGSIATVRASNFGNMVTVLGTADAALLARLRGLFDDHGYRFIPPGALGRLYTGPHAANPAVVDWRSRFFDYL